MTNELISIIIPVYKVENYLERCVESILSQTYTNLEIILVDDGSPDNSGIMCDKYAAKDERIKVLHLENGGAARARNRGLDIASGKFIGFVDSDDYIDKNMYATLYNAIHEYDADIAATGIIREYENGELQSVVRTPSKLAVYSDEETLREILRSRYVGSSVWSKLYKRSCWEKNRFPEGEINEDTKLIFELHDGKKLVHTAQPMYHYIIRSNSVTTSLSLKGWHVTWDNACVFAEKARKYSEELFDDALYYKTSIARDFLASTKNDGGDLLLRKECRQVYNENWMKLDVGVKEILLRINLYHLIKKIVKG